MTKKEAAERQKVAKELCQKDGYDWDTLDDYGKHSYGHYADVVIHKGLQAPKEAVEVIPATPSDQCPTCAGKGFIEENAGLAQSQCADCGGTGVKPDVLTTEVLEKTLEEHPEIKGPTHYVEALNDNISRDRPDNKPTRSRDTSKPAKPRKPKARKKTAG